jgi:hypothetical protein
MVERKTQPTAEKDTRDRRSLTMSEPKASNPVLDQDLSCSKLLVGSGSEINIPDLDLK